MSTLDSWIDRDELAALVAELSPAPEPVAEEAAAVELSAPDEAIEATPEEPAYESVVGDLPEDTFAPAPHYEEAEPITASPQEFESMAEVVMISIATVAPPSPQESEPVAEEPEVQMPDSFEETPMAEDSGEPADVEPHQAMTPEVQCEAPEAEPPPVVADEALVEAPPAAWDFDTPEAYAASPFPVPESANPDAPSTPLRRTAATQASEALERARNRAQLGGLLKSFSPPPDAQAEEVATEPEVESEWESGIEAPAEPVIEAPAAETETGAEAPIPEPVTGEIGQPEFTDTEETVSLDDLPDPGNGPEFSPSPESAQDGEEPTPADGEEPSLGADPGDDFTGEFEESPPLPLRERLRGFASRASLATGSVDVAITDFQSYPLLPGTDAASAPHSALRLAHCFGALAEELKASRAVAADAVLVAGEFAQAHRAAGVEFVGGDADLGAEAELAAVGEAVGDVVEDAGGIDLAQETRRGRSRRR
jgi:hypothetical protein